MHQLFYFQELIILDLCKWVKISHASSEYSIDVNYFNLKTR